MKLGILAYSTQTGLGYQSLSYYKHLNPIKVMHIDISIHNGLQQHPDWYAGDVVWVQGYPKTAQIIEFLTGLDVCLMAETPLNYELFELAKKMGVKTVVAPNYEFFDYFKKPNLPKPDVLVLPSMWHYDELKKWSDDNGVECVYLHHPVDTNEFKFIQRTSPKTFHIAGKPAYEDRNGTNEYLMAYPNGTVLTQSREQANLIRRKYPRIRIIESLESPQDMYSYRDILVMPRKYGGNCLPLNEALACGVPVVMPDVSPNNNLLPKEWLIPAYTAGYFEPRTRVEIHGVSYEDMQKVVGHVAENIGEYSLKAKQIADTISWNKLKDKWLEVLA